ncbi:Sulfotransferase domain-containing protein [Gracilimonas mengyeensis]|uniref:Sulfotransferase domain-containing protein n=2 Tax=Gracilimonas mengyeensis TaxID=1302730 RepID=A0A521D957_9BACT|nr:Sulfotransferase domain-containing protein [Gracilimonas mengyeensis]
MNNWFQYICEENSEQFKTKVDNVVEYRYPLLANLSNSRTVRDLGKILRDLGITLLNKIKGNTPIIKDPIAFFSAEWLSKTYEADVLVAIRHPAAFCSSLKIKNWKFDFNNFLSQPLLMESYLGDYEEDIRKFAQEEQDIIDQAILLWNCIYHTADVYQQKHPDWIFVRHEELSMDPIKHFKSIYRNLDLEFTTQVKSDIVERSGSHNPKEQHSEDEFKRDSKANIKNWKNRLTKKEIDRIRVKTNKVSNIFYDNDDW